MSIRLPKCCKNLFPRSFFSSFTSCDEGSEQECKDTKVSDQRWDGAEEGGDRTTTQDHTAKLHIDAHQIEDQIDLAQVQRHLLDHGWSLG